MKRQFKFFVASVAVAVLATSSMVKAADKDIVDTAVAAGSFKTLAAALGAADLVDALKGPGPITVFAPTDEAFAKLPAGTVETLLKPENKDQLTAVLTYHVVAGQVAAKQVVDLKGAKTLNGQRVDISVADGKVSVDKATVVTTDILCSNGIIHVIDSVILPASDNIVATADKAGAFKTLLAAAKAAGLAEALSGKGPFTVFAPTDEAFAKLPAGTVETLLKPENKGKLAAILKYHVVSGRVYSEDALAAKKAETLEGSEISISVSGGQAKINDANLVTTDLDASNGVIHVIDSVILPPEKKKVSAVEAREMIEQAVAHGAKTFNAGHHTACADLYMNTLREMVEYGDQMPEHVLTSMKHVLTKAEATHCPTQRSWTLRHGLDHAYARMATLQ
ncbi:MAG: fasciclin domain-containing protein [Planctomycetaceae bacterium]|nr:fasciclin domain-containing protein [Planctomycetaceae bacterium]